MSDYKKPMDLTPCAPHLIAVHFADESYTATPSQQKLLCDEMWRRWANHERLVDQLKDCLELMEDSERRYEQGQDAPNMNDEIKYTRELLATLEAGKGSE